MSDINRYEAARLRKRGVLKNIAANLISGQGFGSSIGRGISDTFSSKMLGFKEKFDPLRIAKTFTGNFGASIIGSLTGRSAQDIAYFTGQGVRKDQLGQVGAVDTSFYVTVARKGARLRKNESLADVISKLYFFLQQSYEDKKLNLELNHDLDREKHESDKRRHEELIKAINSAKEIPEKIEPEEKKKKEVPKTKEKEPPTGTPPTPNPPTTPPAATPNRPSIVSRIAEGLTSIAPTASKVAIGAAAAAGITTAASLSIRAETGKSSAAAIKNIGQIVPNDPKPGVSSYGIFGINSQGSIQTFVRDNPQFELTAKPATKEFDEQWKKASKEKPKEMLDAQLIWYDNYITKPLKKDLTKLLPPPLVNSQKVFVFMSDRRVQYGPVMETQALAYASNAKTPEEFINKVSEFDLTHLQEAFPTYLATHPNSIKGLKNRIEERKKTSLKVASSINLGNRLSNSSVENQNLTEESTTNTIYLNNSVTSVSGGTVNKQIIVKPKEDIKPTYMDYN